MYSVVNILTYCKKYENEFILKMEILVIFMSCSCDIHLFTDLENNNNEAEKASNAPQGWGCVVQKENISTTRHLIQRVNDSFRIDASLFNVIFFQLKNLYTWVYLALCNYLALWPTKLQ